MASEIVPYNDEYNFGNLTSDVLGETQVLEDASKLKSKKKKPGQEEGGEPAYLFLDFRRGKDDWPEGVEVVDEERFKELLKQEKDEIAKKAAKKNKKTGGDYGGDTSYAYSLGMAGGGGYNYTTTFWGGMDSDDEEEVVENDGGDGGFAEYKTLDDMRTPAPDVVKFETLRDGSTALLLRPGQRLKIDLKDLYDGGMVKRRQRLLDKVSEQSGGGDKGSDETDFFSNFDDFNWGGLANTSEFSFSDSADSYTITIDFKVIDKLPPSGLALFQTALCQPSGGKDQGSVSQTDAECKVSGDGGVGHFGTFSAPRKDDIDDKKPPPVVTANKWHRIVVAINCSGDGSDEKKKGTMQTYLNGTPMANISRKELSTRSRFSLKDKHLYLFSSGKANLMNAQVAVRAVRIDKVFRSAADVAALRSQDKVLSMHEEKRKQKLRAQRCKLSLARLFPHPRPVWTSPAVLGVFGDAFLGSRPSFGVPDVQAWTFIVFNHAFQRAVREQQDFLDGLSDEARAGVDKTAKVLAKSRHIFREFQRVLKDRSARTLLSFLRKLKKTLKSVDVGDSVLLPMLVAGRELVLVFEAVSSTMYRVVVVNTDPTGGLRYHDVSAAISPPKIKYRVCMVLNGVPKKNALDNVFWMASYGMCIEPSNGDTSKFYEILLPFLTGKPLEESLVEAAQCSKPDAAESDQRYSFGEWRSAQRSDSGYVKTVMAAAHYVLRQSGLSTFESKWVRVAVRAQLVSMVQNDLQHVFPDESGTQVCDLACKQLSYCANKLSVAASKLEAETGQAAPWRTRLLQSTTNLVASVRSSLEACRNQRSSMPHILQLERPASVQFCDSLIWDAESNEPDPGPAITLPSYVPIDFIQLPETVTTYDQAAETLWMCDRLATLIDNQHHCVKNSKLLIFSLIQHVFTRVLPMPKPRDQVHNRSGKEGLERALHSAKRKDQQLRLKADQEGDSSADDSEEEDGGNEEDMLNSDDELERDIAKFNRSLEDDGPADDDDAASSLPQQPDQSTSGENKQALAAGASESDRIPEAVKEVVTQPCVWDQAMIFADQLKLMQILQRLSEHLTAATLSIKQSKELDAVAIVVAGCICAVADSIMRRRAVDQPSEACSHLMGQCRDGRQLGIAGFGIGVDTFRTQTETGLAHQPELCIARNNVLNYFESPEQRLLAKIFSWELYSDMIPNKPLIKYLRNICREVAGPISTAHLLLLTGDPVKSQLHSNYPELHAYQDVCFFWKMLLNPDPAGKASIAKNDAANGWRHMSAKLRWNFDNQTGYQVFAFGDQVLKCAPPKALDKSGKPKPFPAHRYPSTATPSYYLPAPAVHTEDDVIYRPTLPGFRAVDESAEDGESAAKAPPTLTQRDSELLISYLTVPYLRLSLVLTFFSTNDRVHKLESSKLRQILDSVLFEPGAHLSLELMGVAPKQVPTPRRELLGAPFGMLLNELCHSPQSVLEAVLRLLEGALALDTGTVTDGQNPTFNSGVHIILYALRLGARVDNYLTFLIDTAPSEVEAQNSGLGLGPRNLGLLHEARRSIRNILFSRYLEVLDSFLVVMQHDISEDVDAAADEDKKQQATPDAAALAKKVSLVCNLHAHKLLLLRNLKLEDEIVSNQFQSLEEDASGTGSPRRADAQQQQQQQQQDLPAVLLDFSAVCKNILGSFIYLTTRHLWNGSLLIPEHELYDVLTVQRRRLVAWNAGLRQGALDAVLQSTLEMSSASAGAFVSHPKDTQNRWSKVAGERSQGRFTVSGTRSSSAAGRISSPLMRKQKHWSAEVDTVPASAGIGIELDVQIGQMTLRNRHLQPLSGAILAHQDTVEVLGDSGTIQASQLSISENCTEYRLVGLNHDIVFWQTPHKLAPPTSERWGRVYDPSELYESEFWIENLFEPVRRACFNGPEPAALTFLMLQTELPVDAEVAVLLGEHPTMGGPYKLVYLFRRFKCIHVYECISHGREWWWCLHFTTDVRFTLREMQPSTASRSQPFPYWWTYGAGTPFPQQPQPCLYNDLGPVGDGEAKEMKMQSVVIRREPTHEGNLSGGRETFVPNRLLHGSIPDCLLEQYRFWQDESHHNWQALFANGAGDIDDDGIHKMQQYHRRLRGYPVDRNKTDTMLFVEIGSVGDWDQYLSRAYSSADHDGSNGAQDNSATTGRAAAVLGCTGLPGNSVRVWRVPLSRAEAQFQVLQRIASKLETWGLLTTEPVYFPEGEPETTDRGGASFSPDAVGGGGSKVEIGASDTTSRGGSEGERTTKMDQSHSKQSSSSKLKTVEKAVELKAGDSVFFRTDDRRWVAATIQSVKEPANKRGSRTYTVAESLTGNSVPKVSEKRLRPLKDGSKLDPGEGVYHWDGMTDSEDEEWEPSLSGGGDGVKQAPTAAEKSDGKNGGSKSKTRLHFGHFEQLALLFANCGGTEEAVERSLNEFRTRVLDGKKEEAAGLSVQVLKPSHDAQARFGSVGQLVRAILSRCKGRPDDAAPVAAPDPLKAVHSPVGALIPLDEVEMLINLLYAPRASSLHSVARTLSRIENLSFIVAWADLASIISATQETGLPLSETIPAGVAQLKIIELPRLKLRFTPRDGKLYSVDHADMYISNDRHELVQHLVQGIPHALVMSNAQDEKQLLVPVVCPFRPVVNSQPFSTHLVLDRCSDVALAQWYSALTQRYFLYPVHLSLSFLMTKGVNSALYLLLLRFLNRDYAAVNDLTDSIATDTSYSAEGMAIFAALSQTVNDHHPDASACRLKISLVTNDSPMPSPWDLTTAAADFIAKLPHVSAINQIENAEELQLLEDERVVKDRQSPNFISGQHTDYMLTLLLNRLCMLKTMAKSSVDGASEAHAMMQCRAPPRTVSQPWMYHEDNTVLGAEYDDVDQIVEERGLLDALRNTRYHPDDCTTTSIDPGSDEAHRLVVVFYFVRWMKDFNSVLSQVKDLAAQFAMARFVHVEADRIKWTETGHQAEIDNVQEFPAFALYRGSVRLAVTKEGDNGRGAVSTLIQQALTAADRKIFRAQQRREEREKLEREQADGVGDVEEEIPWIWDEENKGERMVFYQSGFTVKLAISNNDDSAASKGKPSVWEWEDNGTFKKFDKLSASAIERWVRTLKEQESDSKLEIEGGIMYAQSVKWDDTNTMLQGIQYFSNRTGSTSATRRRGPYFELRPGLSDDEKPEEALRRLETELRKEAVLVRQRNLIIEGKGRDVEAVRGGMYFEPFTGVHKWDIRFAHEPARGGKFDAVGVCSQNFRRFGPASDRLLGSMVRSRCHSVALYANGQIQFQDVCVATAIAPRASAAPDVVDPTAAAGGDDSPSETRLLSQGTVVTCVLDTDAEGGTLSFEVGGKVVRFKNLLPPKQRAKAGLEDDVLEKFTGVYELLDKATAVYPVISTCPLDEQYTRLEKENELAKALQAETEKERARLLGAVGAGESDSKGEETKTVDVAGVDENDDNGAEENDVTPQELEKIASFTGMAVETLKKQDAKDLRRLWRQVQAELEERRVKVPTIELCISERARRSLSNQETPRIVVGSILTFSSTPTQSSNKEASTEAEASEQEQRVRVLEVVADSTGEQSDGNSPTRDDGDKHEVIRLRVENAPLVAPIDPAAVGDGGSAEQPAAGGGGGATAAAPAASAVEQKSSAEQKEPTADKVDNELQPATTTLLVDMETVRIVKVDDQNVELEFSCENARETSDTGEAAAGVNPEANVWMIKNAEGLWRQLGTVANASVEEGYAKFLSTVDSEAAAKVHMYVMDGGKKYAFKFLKKRDAHGNDGQVKGSDDNWCPTRRFPVAGDTVQRQLSLLSLKYSTVYVLGAQKVHEVIRGCWGGSETMNGEALGLGFMFLYNLLQGTLRAQASSGYSWGRRSSSDSPRLALLLAQLFQDRREKSLCNSIISILNRNRSACIRMPRYNDTRKNNRAPIHNAFLDSDEPQSGLGPHMTQVVKLFQKLQKARGMLKFPPKPPYKELPAHASQCPVPLHSASPPSQTQTHPRRARKNNKFAVTDFSCSQRNLKAVEPAAFRLLFGLLKHETGSSAQANTWRILGSLADGSRLMPHAMVTVNSPTEYLEHMHDVASAKLLAVVHFHARWCPASKALSPPMQVFALKIPTARFFSVDVDDCDSLAEKYGITSLPASIVLRPRLVPQGRGKPAKLSNVDWPERRVNASGPETIVQLATAIVVASTDAERSVLGQTIDLSLFEADPAAAESGAQASKRLVTVAELESSLDGVAVSDAECVANSTSADTMACLANHQFHGHAAILDILSVEASAGPSTRQSSKENASRPGTSAGATQSPLPFNVSAHPDAKSGVARQMIERMTNDMARVIRARATSSQVVVAGITATVLDEFFAPQPVCHRIAKRKIEVAREQVLALLPALKALKAQDERVVQATPPLLEAASNAIGLSKNANEPDQLRQKLEFDLRRVSGQEAKVEMQLIYRALLSSECEEDLLGVNPFMPKELLQTVIDVSVACVLRASRLGHINRCIVAASKLLDQLNEVLEMSVDQLAARRSSLRPNVEQCCASLAGLLQTHRHFVRSELKSTNPWQYDPRYLVFEFVWNIILRQKQVAIIDNFVSTLKQGRSKVKQMIMGQGKTTVVAPILALMLADGDSLVLSVVPPALLEMSRTLMRETFANIMAKRIYTLKFDRSTEIRPSMFRALQNSAVNRGVVVATPSAVKSVMLCFVESMVALKHAPPNDAPKLRQNIGEFTKVLGLFRRGVLLLDEVDMILHPLRSELNFPIGDKYDLDGSENGLRWSLPIHLIDAIFFAQTGKIHVFEESSTAMSILNRLRVAIDAGYASRSLQRLPHVTLLDMQFYLNTMKPILADWAFLWLQRNHLHGVSREEAIRYIIDGAAAKSVSLRVVNALQKDLSWERESGSSSNSNSNSAVQDGSASSPKSRFHQKLQEHLSSSIERLQTRAGAIHEIYDCEDSYQQAVLVEADVQRTRRQELVELKRKIDEAECPPDDSMFNQVVVVVSNAFASRAQQNGSEGSANTSEITGFCSSLEELGFTVRPCDSVKEATARVKELHVSEKLRCVVFDIYDYSEGNTAHDVTFDNVRESIARLVNKGSAFAKQFQPVMPGRFCLVDAMSSLDYKPRAYFWKQKIVVFDKHDACKEWCNVEGPFSAFQPERESQESSEVVTKALRLELEKLQEEFDRTVQAREDADVRQSAKMRNLFSQLQKPLDDDVARISQGLDQLQAFAERVARDAKTNQADLQKQKGPVAPIASVSVVVLAHGVEGAPVVVDLSNVRSWAAMLDAVSLSCGRYIDSDARLLLTLGDPAQPTMVTSWEQYVQCGGGDFQLDQPKMTGARSLFLLSIDVAELPLHHVARAPEHINQQVAAMRHALEQQRSHVERVCLAARVMANVPIQHKKMLNLTHDWLHVFLPHCMKKVNRVSFGLLSDQECARALAVDPLMPQSRLKLGIPFVGKDVPSAASEFAQPDIIIGLTVFGYRYQGLRRQDFDKLVEELVESFVHEIGPPSERPSSILYRGWVLGCGGAIRGLSVDPQADANEQQHDGTSESSGEGAHQASQADASREVVDLKYLQRNNQDQMDKLFNLWCNHAAVIYHYLNEIVFQRHMRSQHTKMSSCGQAIGGDMLFGRRVGFSGTPSDLLPKEMGQCDYEKGDDGKMISTIIDTSIFDVEHLPRQWTIDGLLETIANHVPECHALVDTGALITGYSNFEVAQKLLQLGLDGFDGVVFLDDNDAKKVLMRDTGKIVNQDQCGVPLERRFAFYDQIHTTGMDIKHRVNARAVVTLGKDMVFRDYVQGAYRMRGIGKGQTATVLIIPEVAELMQRQLVAGGALGEGEVVSSLPTGKCLAMIAAWLVVNSMRTEQVQWTMLCIQNVANLYRKVAFERMLAAGANFGEEKPGKLVKDAEQVHGEAHAEASADGASRPPPTEGDDDKTSAAGWHRDTAVFDESIDFSLEQAVPDPLPFLTKLQTMLARHKHYVPPQAESVASEILTEVSRFLLLDGREINLDTEQEREQEQEQEKEVQARKEVQVEVEKFVDREYSRSRETAERWQLHELTSDSCSAFYPMSEFKLRHQKTIDFPQYTRLSSNYYNRKWDGLRRLKNVVMILEWIPSQKRVSRNISLKPGGQDDPQQTVTAGDLEKAFQLLAFEGTTHLNANDACNAVEMATFVAPQREEIEHAMQVISSAAHSSELQLDLTGFCTLLKSGLVYQEHVGRYWVGITLAEAETLRRIIHVANSQGRAVVEGSDVALALRYSPSHSIPERTINLAAAPANNNGNSSSTRPDARVSSTVSQPAQSSLDSFCGIVFDSTANWESTFGQETEPGGYRADLGSPVFQRAVVHSCFRFFDNDARFTDAAANALIRTLQRTAPHLREKFYRSAMACRRRMALKDSNTSLQPIFTIQTAADALKQRAQVSFLRQAIAQRGLTLYEAYILMDPNSNGFIEPAELMGAFDYFNVPATDADDLVDFYQNCDREGSGMMSYAQWIDVFEAEAADGEADQAVVSSDDADGDQEDKEAARARKLANLAPCVPRAAEQLRKIILNRRQLLMKQQRQERLRQQAQQFRLDEQHYRDELVTSGKHHLGSNPKVISWDPAPIGVETVQFPPSQKPGEEEELAGSQQHTQKPLVTLFEYDGNRLPLRHTPVPSTASLTFEKTMMLTEEERSLTGPMMCRYHQHNRTPTKPMNSTKTYCYQRHMYLMCSRRCTYCGRTYSQEVEAEHNAKVESVMRSKPETTFLRSPAGAGFAVQLLYQAAERFGFTVMVLVRMSQLPAPGRLASLVSLLPPPLSPAAVFDDAAEASATESAAAAQTSPPETLKTQQVNFFVDNNGNVGVRLDDASADESAVHESTGKLATGAWHRVALHLTRKDDGSGQVAVEVAALETSVTEGKFEPCRQSAGFVAGGSAVPTASGFYYPTKMVLFNGGTVAEARGGDLSHIAVVRWQQQDAIASASAATLAARFDAAVLDDKRLDEVLHSSTGLYIGSDWLGKLRYEGATTFVLETFPRSNVGLCTSTGRYYFTADSQHAPPDPHVEEAKAEDAGNRKPSLHRMCFVPWFLRPYASKTDVELSDVEFRRAPPEAGAAAAAGAGSASDESKTPSDDTTARPGCITVSKRKLTSTLEGRTGVAELRIPSSHDKLYQGPHLLKALAMIVDLVQSPSKTVRDEFARVAEPEQATQLLAEKVSSAFHRFLRKPIALLVEMLRVCGYMRVEVGTSELPIVMSGGVSRNAVDPAVRSLDIDDAWLRTVRQVHESDDLLRRLEQRILGQVDATKPLSPVVIAALSEVDSSFSARLSLQSVREALQATPCKAGAVLGLACALLRDETGTLLYHSTRFCATTPLHHAAAPSARREHLMRSFERVANLAQSGALRNALAAFEEPDQAT